VNRNSAIPLVLLVATVAGVVAVWAPQERTGRDNLPALQVNRERTAPASGPKIRVGLTDEPARRLQIEVSGPYELRLAGTAETLDRQEKLTPTTVTATPRGLRIGAREFSATRLEIVPAQSPAVWVESHQYRGTLQLFRRAGGTVVAVNVLPLEEYVASVVDSEMPKEFSREARKAQAVVARTFAFSQMRSAARDALFDLYGSTRSQKYLGVKYRDDQGRLLAGESADSREVAAETAQLVCTFRGRLFCTYYSAVCGGCTLRGSEMFADASPALQGVPCDWCRAARLYRWSADFSHESAQSDLQKYFRGRGESLGNVRSLRPIATTAPDELPRFEIRDERRTVTATGADLRLAFSSQGFYSPRFTLEQRGDAWHVSGRGHGHGCGLCQWGARGQAQSGRTFRQILSHYYPGSSLAAVDY
jgi:stage II sporulation protein D